MYADHAKITQLILLTVQLDAGLYPVSYVSTHDFKPLKCSVSKELLSK